jgi:hypothetical protein
MSLIATATEFRNCFILPTGMKLFYNFTGHILKDSSMHEAGKSTLRIWGYRAAGALAAVGAIFGFLIPTSHSLLDRLTNALSFSFLGAILAGLVFLVISIIHLAFITASEKKNPILQGITFITSLFFFFGALDLVLFRGTFMLIPLVNLLYFGGDLTDTYWGCEDYVIMEEGSFCADGR